LFTFYALMVVALLHMHSERKRAEPNRAFCRETLELARERERERERDKGKANDDHSKETSTQNSIAIQVC
jgi:hypothetical protein